MSTHNEKRPQDYPGTPTVESERQKWLADWRDEQAVWEADMKAMLGEP